MTLIIHDGRTFTYSDESITQESIGMLHRLDDKEVRELGKMVNMESPQEKKRRLALKRKWDIEHPGKDDNHYAKASKNIRLDAFLESERWDEIDNLLYLQSDQNNEKRALESKAKIRQFVDTFSKEEKIFIQGILRQRDVLQRNRRNYRYSCRCCLLQIEAFESKNSCQFQRD